MDDLLQPAPSAQIAWAPAQMPAQQRPPMAVSLETLESRICELEQSLTELISRVQPVLAPSAPVGGGAPTPPAPPKIARSAIVDSVDAVAATVLQINAMVISVIKRVEV